MKTRIPLVSMVLMTASCSTVASRVWKAPIDPSCRGVKPTMLRHTIVSSLQGLCVGAEGHVAGRTLTLSVGTSGPCALLRLSVIHAAQRIEFISRETPASFELQPDARIVTIEAEDECGNVAARNIAGE